MSSAFLPSVVSVAAAAGGPPGLPLGGSCVAADVCRSLQVLHQATLRCPCEDGEWTPKPEFGRVGTSLEFQRTLRGSWMMTHDTAKVLRCPQTHWRNFRDAPLEVFLARRVRGVFFHVAVAAALAL